jgi:hypothetical protein
MICAAPNALPAGIQIAAAVRADILHDKRMSNGVTFDRPSLHITANWLCPAKVFRDAGSQHSG